MATPRASLTVWLCVAAVRLFSALVPARARRDWRLEWEAELYHRGELLHARRHVDWRHRMDLFRRVLGALPDAAWLRRQFTADADIVHDLRHGARMLRKSPTFTLSAVLILAVGIGGTVSIVTLLDTLIFRPLPYADAERVMTLWQRRAASPLDLEDVAPANFLDWRERSVSFSAVAAVVPYSHDYTGGREPELLFGAQVTEGFWDALGMQPALGRGFLPGRARARRAERRRHQPRVVAAAVRRRPGDREHGHQHGRRAVDDCRRAPARSSLRNSCRGPAISRSGRRRSSRATRSGRAGARGGTSSRG